MANKVLGRRKKSIKNRNDPRYLSTQKKFDTELETELSHGHVARLSIQKITQRTHVWRTTFYDHFLHLDDALNHFNHRMRPDLKKLEKEIESANCGSEVAFSKILHFIYLNKKYYGIVVRYRNSVALLDVPKSCSHVICKNWSNYGPDANSRCFSIFSWELCGVIYYWGHNEKFSKEKIPSYAKYISRLAHNATQRLS